MSMIEVIDFHKDYEDFKAVKGIDFKIEKGEIVALLGPNGAGKSTTIKAICSFFEPTYGDIKVKGLSVLGNSHWTRSNIGYLPENTPLYLDMLTYDYLAYIAQVKQIKEVDKVVREVAKRCNIDDRLSTLIGNLSKGLRQRVGIAQALIGDADIIILDEPTSGLDPNQIRDVRSLIEDLGKNKTVIISTHVLSEVEATCDRAIIIDKGHIVMDTLVKDISRTKEEGVSIEIVLEETTREKIEDAFNKVEGIISIQIEENKANFNVFVLIKNKKENMDKLYSVTKEGDWLMTKLDKKVGETLEDVFSKLTQGGASD